MAGYTNSFISANGELITAGLFTQEYAALGDAFANGSGHKHDGTAAEGALIPVISASNNEVLCGGTTINLSTDVAAVKTLQLTIGDGAILPAVTNDIDLGSVALAFKDIHVDGTATLASLILASGVTVVSILDDGLMTANSATALATQQSIKTFAETTATNAASAAEAAAVVTANAYTDIEAAAAETDAITAANAYTDIEAAAAETDAITAANSYTDTQIAAASIDGGTY